MYAYNDFDRQFLRDRNAQFRDQLNRHLAGELGDDEFKPLRLQNGWYIQRYAPMLRIAVPYGEIASRQLRVIARIAREYDQPDAELFERAQHTQSQIGGIQAPALVKGVAHFTTRHNIQFNWIPLAKSADVMDLLATVNMHGIQTSGNCIRNITSDAFAGIAPDERRYLPHVTLARMARGGHDAVALDRWVADHAALASPAFAQIGGLGGALKKAADKKKEIDDIRVDDADEIEKSIEENSLARVGLEVEFLAELFFLLLDENGSLVDGAHGTARVFLHGARDVSGRDLGVRVGGFLFLDQVHGDGEPQQHQQHAGPGLGLLEGLASDGDRHQQGREAGRQRQQDRGDPEQWLHRRHMHPCSCHPRLLSAVMQGMEDYPI